jgi:ribosome maturation protein Sdo1
MALSASSCGGSVTQQESQRRYRHINLNSDIVEVVDSKSIKEQTGVRHHPEFVLVMLDLGGTEREG